MGLQRPTDHDDATDAGELGGALVRIAGSADRPHTGHTARGAPERCGTPGTEVAGINPSPVAKCRRHHLSGMGSSQGRLPLPGRGSSGPAPAGAGGRSRGPRASSTQHATPGCGRWRRPLPSACVRAAVRLGRQPDGAEYDLGAYVTAVRRLAGGRARRRPRSTPASRPCAPRPGHRGACRRERLDGRLGRDGRSASSTWRRRRCWYCARRSKCSVTVMRALPSPERAAEPCTSSHASRGFDDGTTARPPVAELEGSSPRATRCGSCGAARERGVGGRSRVPHAPRPVRRQAERRGRVRGSSTASRTRGRRWTRRA